MFELNGTYVIFIGLFMIFVYLLNEIMLKPVGLVMEKRAQQVKGHLDAAKSCAQETETILADYKAKLHTSRVEAQSIIHDALADSQKEANVQLQNIQSEGRNKLNELKDELNAGRQDLLQSLIHPELELVGNILNKLLGEKTALVTDEERVFQVLKETR